MCDFIRANVGVSSRRRPVGCTEGTELEDAAAQGSWATRGVDVVDLGVGKEPGFAAVAAVVVVVFAVGGAAAAATPVGGDSAVGKDTAGPGIGVKCDRFGDGEI